jgi:hypothetical protein
LAKSISFEEGNGWRSLRSTDPTRSIGGKLFAAVELAADAAQKRHVPDGLDLV